MSENLIRKMEKEMGVDLFMTVMTPRRRCPGCGGDSSAVENQKREESQNKGVWELV
jgi:hypothetical protein